MAFEGEPVPCWWWPMARIQSGTWAYRWAGAHQLLDFFPANQHLWVLGKTLHPKEETARPTWGESRLHRLRQGKAKAVLWKIAALPS